MPNASISAIMGDGRGGVIATTLAQTLRLEGDAWLPIADVGRALLHLHRHVQGS